MIKHIETITKNGTLEWKRTNKARTNKTAEW